MVAPFRERPRILNAWAIEHSPICRTFRANACVVETTLKTARGGCSCAMTSEFANPPGQDRGHSDLAKTGASV